MVIQNAIEFTIYITLASSLERGISLVTYYMLATYWMIYAYIYFVGSSTEILSKKSLTWLTALPIGLCILHWSGLLVSGYKHIGSSVVTTPGQFYAVFQLYAIAAVIFAYYALIKTIRRPKNYRVQSRSIVLTLGLLPFSLAGMTVVVLRFFDIEIASAIYLPIGSLIFLASAAICTKQDLFDFSGTMLAIRSGIFRQLIFPSSSEQGKSLTERLAEIEKFMLKKAYEEALSDPEHASRPQKRVAFLLGISEATVSKKLAKYEIKPNNTASKGKQYQDAVKHYFYE